MQTIQKAIGILGGTFDPIHFGHLRMALELYEGLNLAKVHIMPCYQPVHRKTPSANASQRLAMVECAIEKEPALFADPREINRKAPSYTIETLREMRKEMPTTPFCFILGIDAFLGFPSWNEWQEILDYTHIIVAHRPNYNIPTSGIIADLMKNKLQTNLDFIHENLGGGIVFRPITSLEISATDIRKQIAAGKSPRYLLPDSVYDYVKSDGTYSLSQC